MSDHIPDPVKMVSARDEEVERALMAAWCAPSKGVTDEDAFLTALAASLIALAANYYWAPRAEGNRQAIMRALTGGQGG